jgi:hypothetical protein
MFVCGRHAAQQCKTTVVALLPLAWLFCLEPLLALSLLLLITAMDLCVLSIATAAVQ